jgi:hypothetical protein
VSIGDKNGTSILCPGAFMNATVSRDRNRRFYTLLGFAVAAIVLFGFSRTYYLKIGFDTPPLTLRLHLHGFFLTLWLMLFVIQTKLIAAGRRDLHKWLGVAGVVLAVVALATTYAAAVESVRLGGDRGGITAVDRLYSNVLIVTLFGAFVAAGVALRRRPEIHKRFMLLATIAAVGPAANRAIALVVGHGVRDFHILVITALVLAGLFYDWRTRGRPHWVLLCGGGSLIVSQVTRRLVGGSELWAPIGSWLLS